MRYPAPITRTRDSLGFWLPILGNALLTLVLGYLVLGPPGMLYLPLLYAFYLYLGKRISMEGLLRFYRARPLRPEELPRLHAANVELSRRAGLARPPRLFYVPHQMLNAFALGDRHGTGVALTYGLLQRLTERELIGVLGHEIAHIHNGDIDTNRYLLAGRQLIGAFQLMGQLLLYYNLYLTVFRGYTVYLELMLLLLAAPFFSVLLQFAFSRRREYAADLTGAYLAQDPEGLIDALQHIHRYQQYGLPELNRDGRRAWYARWLTTHPPLEQRVRRLRDYARAALVENV